MAQKFIQTNKVLNKLLSGNSSTSQNSQQAGASQQVQVNSNSMSALSLAASMLNSPNEFEKLERKHFDKVYKLADKSLKYCQSEKMNLTNSPPYIIDILPDICQILNGIYNSYDNKLHILNDIEYFMVYIFNLISKFEKLIHLFKQAGKRMYEDTSDERKQLIKYSLIFSHILTEIKSLFPNNIYDGQNFRIAKSDAAEFWKNNFNNRVIAPWNEFHMKLNRVHPILGELEARELRTHLQLTGTRYVSIFEFDVFTRLYQPWNTLLNNWKFLAFTHPGYGAFMTYDEVFKRLQTHIDKPGSYLFRLSCTKLGQWAIGYVTTDKKILQTIPQSLVQALIDGEKQGLYLYPDGRVVHIDIKGQMAISAAERITISKEQYDMYFDMGTSFQLCKICSENNKDRKLEPCGHLICSNCLNAWQDKNGINASCPFCRCEIKAFEPIIINPFKTEQKSVIFDSNANMPNEFEDIDSFNISRSNNGSPFEFTKTKMSGLGMITDDSLADGMASADIFDNSLANSSTSTKQMSIVARAKQALFAQSSTNKDTFNMDLFEDIGSELYLDEGYLKPQIKPKVKNVNKVDNSDTLIAELDNNMDNIALMSPLVPLNVCVTATNNAPSNSNPKNSNSTSPDQMNPRASTSNLQVPNIPPPPLPHISPQLPPLPFQPNFIKFKVDNPKLLHQLTELGYDYTKSACALYIANNDFDTAIDILSNCLSQK